jgi:hypothetical protein
MFKLVHYRVVESVGVREDVAVLLQESGGE